MTGMRLMENPLAALALLAGGLQDEPGTPIREMLDRLIDDIDNKRGGAEMLAIAKSGVAEVERERAAVKREADVFALPDINAPGSKTKH
jgi:hypothetical protein